ncbi:uncharacterized protein LOC100899171 [Galendromus occidentalis]|uniref:Uncharacterized protein LOC100899171 n=1 Tax=Galendromus occidentalis TaxID=34638 RepID=A0AAJ6QQA5_9ACAR|nr:uncharacterized protein LOC100899171 [Galendromus occidentalis]
MAVSQERNGALCKVCVFIARNESGRRGCRAFGVLVNSPLATLARTPETPRWHDASWCHVKASIDAEIFLKRFEDTEKLDTGSLADEGRRKQAIESRKNLSSIVKTMILCGVQGSPLKGHRNDGDPSEESRRNDRNIRAFLRFRVGAGHVVVRDHLSGAGSNDPYISPKIQNEVMKTTGKIFRQKICA